MCIVVCYEGLFNKWLFNLFSYAQWMFLRVGLFNISAKLSQSFFHLQVIVCGIDLFHSFLNTKYVTKYSNVTVYL